MDKDLQRQIVNVVSYALTVIVNGLAVALPLNGLATAEISDRFPVLVTPAGYVFSIWSLIYLLLAAFTLYQALPSKRQQPDLRAIGYLPALAGLLNAAWVLLWHYEVFVLTVPVMLALLGTLVLIHRRLRPTRRAGGLARWVVALPFSVYLGWITVATIANISQMLYRAGYRGEPLGEELWALIILAVGVGIAATVLLREFDWAYGLVIVWAYVGIAAEQEALLAVVASLVGAVAVGVLIAYVLLRLPQARASSGATPA
jgi:hypothetical protein